MFHAGPIAEAVLFWHPCSIKPVPVLLDVSCWMPGYLRLCSFGFRVREVLRTHQMRHRSWWMRWIRTQQAVTWRSGSSRSRQVLTCSWKATGVIASDSARPGSGSRTEAHWGEGSVLTNPSTSEVREPSSGCFFVFCWQLLLKGFPFRCC